MSIAVHAAASLTQLMVAATPPTYTATILPQIDTTNDEFNLTYTTPFGLNDNGAVVGDLGNRLGFHWSPTDGASFLQPQFSSVADSAVGRAINNAGTIVGAYTPTGAFRQRPFALDSNGDFTALPTLGPDFGAGVADVNDSGMMVGSGESGPGGTFGGPTSTLYWLNGALHDIGGLGGTSSNASAVNNHSVITGSANMFDFGPLHPYRWTEGGGFEVLPQLVAGVPSSTSDINDHGVVVGRGGVSLAQNRPVYWDAAGNLHQLAQLDAAAIDVGVLGVNNDHVMVGFELASSSFEFEARLWFDETPYHLQDLVTGLPDGAVLRRATEINEHGQIVVEASVPNGRGVEFITVVLSPVPAPGGAATFATGALLLGARRRRR